MLSKKEKIEKLQPVIDFFASVEVGKILSHSGLFPSVHPDLDNNIPAENKLMWLGWDYIYNNDITINISVGKPQAIIYCYSITIIKPTPWVENLSSCLQL